MNALEVIQHFIDAFNRHDADAVNALYAEGASYHSPRFDQPVKGQAIADFNKSVLTAYPDLRFEVISSGDIGGGLVATQMMLRGTHTVRSWTVHRLPVAKSSIRWLPSLRLKAIRSVRSTYT
jgi:ketosteroid isomerase-like protein